MDHRMRQQQVEQGRAVDEMKSVDYSAELW